MPPICMHCISNSNTTNIINLTCRHNTHTSNSNTTNIINLTRRHNTHTIESFILTGSPHSWGHCYVPPGWVAYWLWWPSLPQVVAWDTCTNGVSYDCSFFFFLAMARLYWCMFCCDSVSEIRSTRGTPSHMRSSCRALDSITWNFHSRRSLTLYSLSSESLSHL